MPPVVYPIAYGIAGALQAAGVMVITAQIIPFVQAALIIGAGAAYGSYSKNRAQRKAAQALEAMRQPVSIRNAIAPAQYLYGRRRIPGVLVFCGCSGVKNEYLNLVIAFTAHKMSSLESVMVGEDVVPINGLGQPTSGEYVEKAQFIWHNGDDSQAADSGLIAAMPSYWTVDHKLSGVSYLYCWLKYDTETFPGGGIPNITIIGTGLALYDIRDGSTAYSKNPALCIYDYLTNADRGLGVATSDIDAVSFTASANACDAARALAGGGTEPTYECNYLATADQAPEDVLTDMVQSMAARLVCSGGKWFLLTGYQTPTVSFSEGDLAGPVTLLGTRVSVANRANGARGTFLSESNKWQASDYPAYQSETYLAADDGREAWIDLDLPCTTSASMAQRITKIELERIRREITCKIITNLKGLQVKAGDTIQFSFAHFGWVNKTFEVINWKLSGDEGVGVTVEMTLKETDVNVFAWTAAEEKALPPAPATFLPNPHVVTAPSSVTLASASDGLQADGTVIPRLLLAWTPPSDQFVQSGGRYVIEYKEHAASDWIEAKGPLGAATFAYITAVKVGSCYDVRIKSVNTIGVSSPFVTIENVEVFGDTVAPATPTGLTAKAGTGKAIALDWFDNPESDLLVYAIYRNTSNNSGTALKIAEARVSAFVDADVLLGSTLYYWIKAIDRSGNLSAFSAVAYATVSRITDGDTDASAPATPAAPTYDSSGTQTATDGTVNAYIVIAFAAMTAGMKYQEVFCRVNGTGDEGWVSYGKYANATAGTARVDGLIPGADYEFALRGFSFNGTPSAYSTALDLIAPGNSTVPTTPTGGAVDAAYPHVDARLTSGTGKYSLMGVEIKWNYPAEKDIDYVLIEWTSNNSAPLMGMVITDNAGPGVQRVGKNQNWAVIYKTLLGADGYAQIKFVNTSGVSSLQASVNLSGSFIKMAGSAAAQDVDAMELEGLKLGSASASSVRKVVAVYHESKVVSLAGGTSETFTVDLTNRGFTTAPEVGQITCDYPVNELDCAYDYINGGNSSTTAYIAVNRPDGTSYGAGLRRFSIELIQYA
jgi:hypothetical protein